MKRAKASELEVFDRLVRLKHDAGVCGHEQGVHELHDDGDRDAEHNGALQAGTRCDGNGSAHGAAGTDVETSGGANRRRTHPHELHLSTEHKALSDISRILFSPKMLPSSSVSTATSAISTACHNVIMVITPSSDMCPTRCGRAGQTQLHCGI